jgi:hypothetical protein
MNTRYGSPLLLSLGNEVVRELVTNFRNPPLPPFAKGSCEKIQIREWKASLVVQGEEKFAPPKSGGTFVYPKGSPHFPQRSVGILEQTRVNTIRFSLGQSISSVPPGNEENSASFWQANFPSLWTWLDSPIPQSLGFITASGGLGGISWPICLFGSGQVG